MLKDAFRTGPPAVTTSNTTMPSRIDEETLWMSEEGSFRAKMAAYTCSGDVGGGFFFLTLGVSLLLFFGGDFFFCFWELSRPRSSVRHPKSRRLIISLDVRRVLKAIDAWTGYGVRAMKDAGQPEMAHFIRGGKILCQRA